MLKVGTFSICGNMQRGYWIVDRDSFNNWGTRKAENGENFKTRNDATEYARRCHEFKIGRRMAV